MCISKQHPGSVLDANRADAAAANVHMLERAVNALQDAEQQIRKHYAQQREEALRLYYRRQVVLFGVQCIASCVYVVCQLCKSDRAIEQYWSVVHLVVVNAALGAFVFAPHRPQLAYAIAGASVLVGLIGDVSTWSQRATWFDFASKMVWGALIPAQIVAAAITWQKLRGS
jgi:hypothetical protein